MKQLRFVYMLLAWGIELYAFQRWFVCRLFGSNFYFTPNDLATHLINDTNADKGMPLLVVRMLHNKVLALGWGFLQTLLQYWDVRFLEEFIGVVGAVGVALGLWYLFTRDRKNIVLWILFALSIILSLFEMFVMPSKGFTVVLVLFGAIVQAISLYGIWQFLKIKSVYRFGIITILFLFSILFLSLFPLLYQSFCVKI